MRFVGRVWAGLLLAGLVGCGSSNEVAVTGRVTLDGEPLPGAVLTFHPVGATGGLGGSGRTGTDGSYALTAARGGKGVLPGEYRVTVSRLLRRDGSAPDPGVPPAESDARETLPNVYTDPDATPLKVTVSAGARVHDLALLRAPPRGR